MGTARNNSKDNFSLATIFNSLQLSVAATTITAPVINVCNFGAVSKMQYSGLTYSGLFKKIHAGELNKTAKQIKPGIHNFLAGLPAHYSKEIVRSLYKGPGLACVMPSLQAHFAPHQAAQLSAIGLASAEMLIATPFDNRRIARQSGDPLNVSRFYKGALVNGIRQYIVWLSVNYNNMLYDPWLKENGFDPYGLLGIAIKAYPQAATIILPVYPLESVRNVLQFKKLPDKSNALDAARFIYKTEGFKGFFRGYLIKTPGAAIQHAAALGVMSWGKRRLALQQENHSDEQPKQTSSFKRGA